MRKKKCVGYYKLFRPIVIYKLLTLINSKDIFNKANIETDQ